MKIGRGKQDKSDCGISEALHVHRNSTYCYLQRDVMLLLICLFTSKKLLYVGKVFPEA